MGGEVVGGVAVRKRGRPAGSRDKRRVVNELLASDPVFLSELADRSKQAYGVMYVYLLDLVEGRGEEEQRVTNRGDIVGVKVSHDVRVKAAKVLKELTLDKVLADKRDAGHERGKDAGTGLRDALMEIEKQRRKARESGKLKEIGELVGAVNGR